MAFPKRSDVAPTIHSQRDGSSDSEMADARPRPRTEAHDFEASGCHSEPLNKTSGRTTVITAAESLADRNKGPRILLPGDLCGLYTQTALEASAALEKMSVLQGHMEQINQFIIPHHIPLEFGTNIEGTEKSIRITGRFSMDEMWFLHAVLIGRPGWKVFASQLAQQHQRLCPASDDRMEGFNARINAHQSVVTRNVSFLNTRAAQESGARIHVAKPFADESRMPVVAEQMDTDENVLANQPTPNVSTIQGVATADKPTTSPPDESAGIISLSNDSDILKRDITTYTTNAKQYSLDYTRAVLDAVAAMDNVGSLQKKMKTQNDRFATAFKEAESRNKTPLAAFDPASLEAVASTHTGEVAIVRGGQLGLSRAILRMGQQHRDLEIAQGELRRLLHDSQGSPADFPAGVTT